MERETVYPKLVDAATVADVLSVDIEHVNRLARDNRIPSLKIGYRTRRFDLTEVIAALRQPPPRADQIAKLKSELGGEGR